MRTTRPLYPEAARRARIQGDVVLSVTVDKEGAVIGVETESGDPALAKAAMDAVRQWRYSPPGMAPALTTVTVSFVLDGPAPTP